MHQLDSACADAVLPQCIPGSGLCIRGQQVSWFFNKCEILALAAVLCQGPCYFMYLGQAYSFFSSIFQGAEVLLFTTIQLCFIAISFQGDPLRQNSPWRSSFPNKDTQWEFLPIHLGSNLELKAEAIRQGLSTSMNPLARWAPLDCSVPTGRCY